MKISKYEGNPLLLRQEVANAKLPDGRSVEVSLGVGGGTLFGMVRGKQGHIATYRITPHDFVNEILACEDGTATFDLIVDNPKEEDPK